MRGAPLARGVVFVLATGVLSCHPQPPQQQAVAPGEAYVALYGAADRKVTDPRGTIRGDFQWAASAPDLAAAATRWEEFIRAHGPAGGDFEDSLHASYFSAAQYELVRVYYLQGRRSDGDVVMRRLDPVGWVK